MGKNGQAAKQTDTDQDVRRVLTPKARGSYLHIFQPKAFKGQNPKYSATLLFDKDDTDMSELEAARDAALEEQFGANHSKWPKDLDDPIRDGDDESQYPDKDVYRNHWVVKASSNEDNPPGVFDKQGKEVIDAKKIISGDYIRAKIFAIAWDTAGNRGASFLLDGVQLMEKGEPLSSRGKSGFDPIAGADDDDAGDADGEEDFD